MRRQKKSVSTKTLYFGSNGQKDRGFGTRSWLSLQLGSLWFTKGLLHICSLAKTSKKVSFPVGFNSYKNNWFTSVRLTYSQSPLVKMY